MRYESTGITAGQLIEELSKLPPDAEVLIYDEYNYPFVRIEGVTGGECEILLECSGESPYLEKALGDEIKKMVGDGEMLLNTHTILDRMCNDCKRLLSRLERKPTIEDLYNGNFPRTIKYGE